MGRFAHIADVHIGAWREDVLAEINMQFYNLRLSFEIARRE